MTGRLSGLTAFVTGAGQGIGRAIALAYAAEGAKVFAASRTASKLDDLHGAFPLITPVALDVTDGPAVARIIGDASPLDVLVNCAGWVHGGTLLETSEADWAKSFDQNVTSMFHTIKAALPAMLERRSGSIINVASVASSITGVAGRAAYGASKAAVVRATEVLADELREQRIRVNCVLPSVIDSPANRSWMPPKLAARAVPASAIAPVIAFLLGPESAPVSGARIPVYGDA